MPISGENVTYIQRETRAVQESSNDDGTRLSGRGIVWTRVGITVSVARAAKGRRSCPVRSGDWSMAPVAGRRAARVCVWPASSTGGLIRACARAYPRRWFSTGVCAWAPTAGQGSIPRSWPRAGQRKLSHRRQRPFALGLSGIDTSKTTRKPWSGRRSCNEVIHTPRLVHTEPKVSYGRLDHRCGPFPRHHTCRIYRRVAGAHRNR